MSTDTRQRQSLSRRNPDKRAGNFQDDELKQLSSARQFRDWLITARREWERERESLTQRLSDSARKIFKKEKTTREHNSSLLLLLLLCFPSTSAFGSASNKKIFVFDKWNVLEYLLPRGRRDEDEKWKALWRRSRLSRWHFWFLRHFFPGFSIKPRDQRLKKFAQFFSVNHSSFWLILFGSFLRVELWVNSKFNGWDGSHGWMNCS